MTHLYPWISDGWVRRIVVLNRCGQEDGSSILQQKPSWPHTCGQWPPAYKNFQIDDYGNSFESFRMDQIVWMKLYGRVRSHSNNFKFRLVKYYCRHQTERHHSHIHNMILRQPAIQRLKQKCKKYKHKLFKTFIRIRRDVVDAFVTFIFVSGCISISIWITVGSFWKNKLFSKGMI